MMNLCDNTKGGSIYVFDLDGTIADTKPGIIEALNYVLKSKNYKTIDKNEEDKYKNQDSSKQGRKRNKNKK